jgi:cardiolipin synthase
MDAAEFWPRAEADIRAARERVFVQALSFEGDDAGRGLALALVASPARDRRVVVDEFSRHVVSDRFLYWPSALLDPEVRREVRSTEEMIGALRECGVPLRFTSPVGPLLLRAPRRNHKKLVLVDERVAYLGGINFTDHNFAWRDLMLRVESASAARFLAQDFEKTWEGRPAAASCRLPGLELMALDGHGNEERFEPLLALIDAARRSLYVECAYLTAPFLERLTAASRRGVAVTLVTPERNNWRLVGDLLSWPPATGGMDVRHYAGRMTHMKALLADDTALVLGSANFDLWSYHFQAEYLALVTDPAVIADFRSRLMAAGMAGSRPVAAPAGRLRGAFARLALQALERAALKLCRA